MDMILTLSKPPVPGYYTGTWLGKAIAQQRVTGYLTVLIPADFQSQSYISN